MSVTIRLPGSLRQWADNQRYVEVETVTCVGDAIQALCRSYPAVGERVLDDDGQPRRFVNVYINGDDIRLLQGTETPVREGDEVILAPAVAGG